MHRIQLKGPWEYRPISGGNTTEPTADGMDHSLTLVPERIELPAPGTIKFPASWDVFLGDFRGTVEFRRPFNCPTNLSDKDRIDLVLDGVGGDADVKINGVHLGDIPNGAGRGRFDVTRHLRFHNEIRVTVIRTLATPDPCGLWGTVSLEISDTNSA